MRYYHYQRAGLCVHRYPSDIGRFVEVKGNQESQNSVREERSEAEGADKCISSRTESDLGKDWVGCLTRNPIRDHDS
jgi:hypothetical protein